MRDACQNIAHHGSLITHRFRELCLNRSHPGATVSHFLFHSRLTKKVLTKAAAEGTREAYCFSTSQREPDVRTQVRAFFVDRLAGVAE